MRNEVLAKVYLSGEGEDGDVVVDNDDAGMRD